jgi:oleandomycin transport system ATP-binding protein
MRGVEHRSHAIYTEELAKRYGTTTALAGLDLAVPPGVVQGVLGPNGAGKTTLVRILATLLRPDGGRALVGGLDVVRQPGKVRPLIGLTGQFAAVDEDLTGQENLLLIARLLELGRKPARRRTAELLDRFGLAEAGRRLAKTYSGGMRRRLDLAMGLVGEPEVLFLDEPTTGLDPRARGELWDMVRGLVAGGATVLLTTQDLAEADRLASQIAVIDHGRVIASGTPAELKAKAGGQSLDVRPAERGQLPRASAIVGEVLGTAAVPAEHDGAVTVPLAPGSSGTDVLAALSRRLSQAGIEVTELGLRLASLDEVFLSLTGPRHDGGDE